MPDLRILTWNSTGEDNYKAAELRNEINYLNVTYPGTPTKVVLNQEAQAPANGPIYNMLNDTGGAGIGPNYTRPPMHIQEMIGGGGRGYTALTHNTLGVTVPLRLHDYTQDAIFTTWVNSLYPSQRTTVWNEVANWRPPAYMQFNYANNVVRLITWHAPLGRSGLLVGCTTRGGAPLDAFLFLEQSRLLNRVAGVDIVIIAGDLNMTAQDLSTTCQGYEPLAAFTGESNNLDHILGWRHGAPVNYAEARAVRSSSVHDIFSCRVSW